MKPIHMQIRLGSARASMLSPRRSAHISIWIRGSRKLPLVFLCCLEWKSEIQFQLLFVVVCCSYKTLAFLLSVYLIVAFILFRCKSLISDKPTRIKVNSVRSSIVQKNFSVVDNLTIFADFNKCSAKYGKYIKNIPERRILCSPMLAKLLCV